MFIDTLLKKGSFAPEERNVFRLPNVSLLRCLEVGLGRRGLKTFGPAGTEDKNTNWFITRTLQSGHYPQFP